MNKEKSVRQILDELKAERASIDQTIKVLEARISGKIVNNTSIISSTDTSEKGAGIVMQPEAFVGLSVIDGIKKYLSIVGQPARSTPEIRKGLKEGGLEANPATLNSILSRAAKKRLGIRKTALGWGLLEWYPKTGRTRKNGEKEDIPEDNKEETK